MASLTIFPYNDEKVAYSSALVLGLQRLKQGGHELQSPIQTPKCSTSSAFMETETGSCSHYVHVMAESV